MFIIHFHQLCLIYFIGKDEVFHGLLFNILQVWNVHLHHSSSQGLLLAPGTWKESQKKALTKMKFSTAVLKAMSSKSIKTTQTPASTMVSSSQKPTLSSSNVQLGVTGTHQKFLCAYQRLESSNLPPTFNICKLHEGIFFRTALLHPLSDWTMTGECMNSMIPELWLIAPTLSQTPPWKFLWNPCTLIHPSDTGKISF